MIQSSKWSLLIEKTSFSAHRNFLPFQFEGLVSGIGGLLGLWIGLSMLSICELFDVALDLWGLFLLRGKREKYKKMAEEQAKSEEKIRPMTSREKSQQNGGTAMMPRDYEFISFSFKFCTKQKIFS